MAGFVLAAGALSLAELDWTAHLRLPRRRPRGGRHRLRGRRRRCRRPSVRQLAKFKGASRVIGSAGSDEKVALLVEVYGFDASFAYRNGPVSRQLREAAPVGLDVYFVNVGGDLLEGGHRFAGTGAGPRVAVCAMIAAATITQPAPGPRGPSPAASRPGAASRASWWKAVTTTTCGRSSCGK
ncbi:hypothetical protein SHIRM173S_11067 [Streptomyces hirsutus]